MNEIIEQFLTYLQGIWRHRWYALGIAWLGPLADCYYGYGYDYGYGYSQGGYGQSSYGYSSRQ